MNHNNRLNYSNNKTKLSEVLYFHICHPNHCPPPFPHQGKVSSPVNIFVLSFLLRQETKDRFFTCNTVMNLILLELDTLNPSSYHEAEP